MLDSSLNDATPLLSLPSRSSSTSSISQGPSALLQITIISIYVTCWVSQAEVAQAITTGAAGGAVYEKPGFICYLNHTILILFGPIIAGICAYQNVQFTVYLERWRGAFTWGQIWREYGLVSVGYYICIFAWLQGLVYVTVSTSNAIYQMQCVFTVLFSVIFLNETFTRTKAAGTLLSFIGIVIVVLPPLLAHSTEGAPPKENVLLGSLLTLLSGLMWGAYEVGYTYTSNRKNKNGVQAGERGKLDAVMETMTSLFIIGVANAAFTWPFLILLHFTGVETLELPTASQWLIVSGNAGLSFVFDLSFALAIFLTNPILVSISSALVIPLSFLADYFIHGTAFYYVSFGGTVVVVLGLYVMNSEDEDEDEDEDEEENDDDDDSEIIELAEGQWEKESGGGGVCCWMGKKKKEMNQEEKDMSKGSVLGRGSKSERVQRFSDV